MGTSSAHGYNSSTRMMTAPQPQFASSDEAPDTGEESDEEIMGGYVGGSSSKYLPSINVSSHSHRVLEDNLLQLSEINENIQRMRLENTNKPPCKRLSLSCPSLNDNENNCFKHPSVVSKPEENKKPPIPENGNKTGLSRKRISRSSRRSVSASSGDSEDDVIDGNRARQRSSSSIGIFAVPAAPPPLKLGVRAKRGVNNLSALLHKSVSTPSIVDGKKKGVSLPEPTHLFIQKLISDHEWAGTHSVVSESESEDDFNREKIGQQNIIPPPVSSSSTSGRNHASPQLSLTEFLRLQDNSSENAEENRKRRRKKERSSIFFRRKKDKGKNASYSSAPTKTSAFGRSQSQPYGSVPSLRKYSSHSMGRAEDDPDESVHLLDVEFMPGEDIFPEGGPAKIRSLDTDPLLKIEESEPENWQQTRRPADIAGLSSQDIKRQEHIYEFIVTESNHCQVLRVIQKVFIEGMIKYLNLTPATIDKMFPCLDLMIKIHFKFLENLRIRQNQEPIVETIDDILLETFGSVENATNWRTAYGTFCSRHTEAVTTYKDIYKSDRRFQQFIRQCTENPLLKKKGIPECILFITTRITKYPLLIEPLIKTARGRPEEQNRLTKVNELVRSILNDVNSKVAEKDRESRLMEIYSRIDPKSSLLQRGKKFKKSDVLSSSRRLMFEGIGSLQQTRNRNLPVHIVVLSDIVFFLQDNGNQKFVFVTPDNKPAILPVRTLIAREKTGLNTKSLYLISTSESEPEMYQIDIIQPSTREEWIRGIREAVDVCSPGSDSEATENHDELHSKDVEAKYLRTYRLISELRKKDVEIARIFEDKMRLMSDSIRALGNRDPYYQGGHSYLPLVRDSSSDFAKDRMLNLLQEASRVCSHFYSSPSSSLSRSVSSVGESKSNAYTTPILPKRAETFGGFDQQLPVPSITVGQTQSEKTSQQLSTAEPLLIHLDPEHQKSAVKLTDCINSLICLVSEHFTSLEGIKTELNETREKANLTGGRYKHNQQLEELRNLQDKFTQDKLSWQREISAKEMELEEEKKKLKLFKIELESQKNDVAEQRNQLYRKLEALKAQGIDLASNMTVLHSSSEPPPSSGYVVNVKVHDGDDTGDLGSPSSISKRKTSTANLLSSPSNNVALGSAQSLSNINLFSTMNESVKSIKDSELKQQIPVKLSKLSSASKEKSKKNSFMGTKTKPTSYDSNITQLLPFKLSETDKKNPKLLSSSSLSYHKMDDSFGSPSTHEISHKRTGSSPVSMPLPPRDSNSVKKEQSEEKVVFL